MLLLKQLENVPKFYPVINTLGVVDITADLHTYHSYLITDQVLQGIYVIDFTSMQ